MNKSRLMGIVCALGIAFTSSVSIASPVTITGYDIYDTNTACCGWDWTYTGSIDATSTGGSYFDYTGGTGTLADGVIGTSVSNTMLFTPETSLQRVVLHLDDYYSINTIEIYGGTFNNVHPGHFDEVDVTVNGNTHDFLTEGFGLTYGRGYSVNNRITISGSALDGLVTNEIVLDNWKYDSDDTISFAITEIFIDGQVVPIPAAVWLFGSGLLGLLGIARRKKSV